MRNWLGSIRNPKPPLGPNLLRRTMEVGVARANYRSRGAWSHRSAFTDCQVSPFRRQADHLSRSAPIDGLVTADPWFLLHSAGYRNRQWNVGAGRGRWCAGIAGPRTA